VFGGLNVIMPPWIYDALLALAAASGIGLALKLVRPRNSRQATPPPRPAGWKTRQAFAMAAFALIVFIGLLRWSALTPASQGRLMFPCIAAFGMAWVYGLGSLHRRMPSPRPHSPARPGRANLGLDPCLCETCPV
jgi:hypothetical protein